ncbi:MAG: hypothetical protein QOD30_44, partial [Actinomycetota bacterium]|nr:hypothetical protein [Actinomycetota bacterium]
FDLDERTANDVEEICRRLDGIPLAIELASARLRAFTAREILDGLHDRFRLLTGGARSAVQRQHTLQASVQWSHDLLTEPERVLLRRLAVCSGSFDVVAAEAIATGEGLERHQVRDQLVSLVDKSLVLAEHDDSETRYRLLETVRQFAFDRLGDAAEIDACRRHHRDHYLTALSAVVVEDDLDNARVAMRWSLERDEPDEAIAIAQALMPVWIGGRYEEGRRWFDDALGAVGDIGSERRLVALTCDSILAAFVGSVTSSDRAAEAVAIARTLDDPVLLASALHAAGNAHIFVSADATEAYYGEGAAVSEAAGLPRELARNLDGVAGMALVRGHLDVAYAEWERSIATLTEAGLGDDPLVFQEHTFIADNDVLTGWPREAIARAQLVLDARAVPAPQRAYAAAIQGTALAMMGEHDAARARIAAAWQYLEGVAAAFFDINVGIHSAMTDLACGDLDRAASVIRSMLEWARQSSTNELLRAVMLEPLIPLMIAQGELDDASAMVDELCAYNAATHSLGPYRRGRCAHVEGLLALALGDDAGAEDAAHRAIAHRTESGDRAGVCDSLDVLAASLDEQRAVLAARLLGGIDAERDAIPYVRPSHDAARYEAVRERLRASLGDEAFEQAHAEGSTLSRDELVAFATRRRGTRRRATRGWASLTSAELDVVRLVSDGLANKEIATRLLVSPRTVQAHLTHIYAKLDITSRVQLAQYASQQG